MEKEKLTNEIRIAVANHSKVDVDGDIHIVSPKAFAYKIFNIMVEYDGNFINELINRGKNNKD